MIMNDTELEAVNYTIGNLQLAGLFARLVDMQAENDALTCETEDLRARVEQLERDALCR
jgi:regulator of replication initiation timing